MHPVVKWAGGKRQLLDRIVERMPKEYNDYYEPFIGGGAVLFGARPDNAVINDINSELINLYITIKENPADFIEQMHRLDAIDCDKDFYYKQRDRYNTLLRDKELSVELAVLFVWLNKHCFNGLYRVNGKGFFNVPWNNKGSGASIDDDNIFEMSEFLQHVAILNGDFEVSLKTAKCGDFVFIDSPYAPLNATSFESYTKEGFAEEEHRRLAKVFENLTERGCYCMLTNHNTPLIQELYSKYTIEEVDVKRLINRNADSRNGKEIIVRNYL